MINPEELKIRDNDGTNKKIAMDIRDKKTEWHNTEEKEQRIQGFQRVISVYCMQRDRKFFMQIIIVNYLKREEREDLGRERKQEKQKEVQVSEKIIKWRKRSRQKITETQMDKCKKYKPQKRSKYMSE